MSIQRLTTPTRTYGEPIPVAPDTNAEVAKINELVDAFNAGLAVSNAVVGGPKYVRYTSSLYYNVPADALTLDRLDVSMILPGNLAVVINPAASPLTDTEPSQQYVATIVPAATAGAVQVPAYSGAPAGATVAIQWQAVTTADSFTKLLASELPAGKEKYAGLELRPLLIAIIGGLGSANTIVTTPAPTTQPAAPTNGVVNDAIKEFTFKVNPLYPSYTQYKENGRPGTTAPAYLSAATAYQVGDTVHVLNLAGAKKGSLAYYVAGSGNIPDGKVLTNGEDFTGSAVVTPPTTTLAVGLAIAVASITAGSPLTFTVTATGGTAPYVDYEVVATNTATGVLTVLGTSDSGSWTPSTPGTYDIAATVTDTAGISKTSVTRTLRVDPVANQLPVANAGSDLTITSPTSAVQLMGSGTDADGPTPSPQWTQVTGPNTAVLATASLLNTAASGLVVGIYQFRLTVTDDKGGTKFDDVIVTVTAQAVPTITSFTPGSGPVGLVLTLIGTGFGATQGSSTLTINGVQAPSVTSWSDTSVQFTVPTGATTGKITLTTAAGTAISATDFSVQLPAPTAPIISGFSPTTGGQGATVRVNGARLMAANPVMLGNVAITNYTINNDGTLLTFTVPAGAATGLITVTTAAGSASTSQAFVVQASNTNTVVTPDASNLQFNTLNQVDSSGHPQFSVLSEYVEDMTATSAVFTVRTGLRGSLGANIPKDEASVGIYLDDQFLTYLAPSTDNVSQDFTVQLPGTGVRRLRTVNGNAVRIEDAGDIKGTILEKITFPSGTVHTPLTWVKQPRQVAWFGDSIWTGLGSDVPTRDAAAILLRQLFPTIDFTLMDSYGSKKTLTAFGTPAARAASLAQVDLLFANCPQPFLFIALGYNDGDSTAAVAAAIAAFVDLVKAKYAATKVVICTIIPALGNKDAMRAAQRSVQVGRESFVEVVEGGFLFGLDKLVDGVHENSAGNLAIAKRLALSSLCDGPVGDAAPPAGYTGALAPAVVESDETNTAFVSTSGAWHVLANSLYRNGTAMVLDPGATGSRTYRFWGRGFRLFATTYQNQYAGALTVKVNGEVLLPTQFATNPKQDGTSWAYFISSPTVWQQYVVELTADGSQGYYLIDDGLEVLDGSGNFLTN